MMIPFKLIPMWFFRGLLATALVAGTVGCASAPVLPAVVQVQGNGHCNPSVDLPVKKTMKKLNPVDTFMEDVFGLLASERHDHASDIRDYNSLYKTCVTDAAGDPLKDK